MSQLINRIVRVHPRNGYTIETMTKLASFTGNIKAEQVEGKVESELSASYASRIFTEIIVLDMSEMLTIQPDEGMTREEREAFNEAKKTAYENIFVRGINFENAHWVALTSTPSEKKQGKAIFVREEEEQLLNEELGLNIGLLDGQSYVKTIDKLLPNCFSGQSEGSIAKAGLGMKNIFLMASRAKGTFYRHENNAKNLLDLDIEGNIVGKIHDGKLENKVGDAQGMAMREALPEYRNAFIEIAKKIDNEAAEEMLKGNVVSAIKTAYFHQNIDTINSKIRKMAIEGKVDLYWMEQIRGKGMKATIVDYPVVLECIKENIAKFDGFFGEVKHLTELIAENKIILATEDCMKASSLWSSSKEAWENWTSKGYDRIWVCDNGHISATGEARNIVNTSRQHLCPIVGAQAEEKKNIAKKTHDALKSIIEEGSAETRALANIFGEEATQSVIANYMDTDTMLPIRNYAEQGKVKAPGAWGMIQWDVRPMLAVTAHLENEEERAELIEKMRTLKGDTIAFTKKAKFRVGAIGRYPSLGMNLAFAKIESNYDLCPNAIFMSWDLLANDILKADTDGDHCVVYLPESKEEADNILEYIG